MKVLVIGATGLVGSHAMARLAAAGHRVTGASRAKPAGAVEWYEFDFTEMTEAQAWFPYLAGFDAVVNCVGIIREARTGDFDLLHRAVPVALFEACEQLGIHRVVQVSALGSAPDAATPYWRSKGAADTDLLARDFGTVVRPSLVYGTDGASSRVFRVFATLPFLMMPAANSARVQPIHVEDLAETIVRLLTMEQAPRLLATVGPRAMTMAGYIAALRRGMRARCGCVADLPRFFAGIAAWFGAKVPSSPLTPDALTMLYRSADGSNTADAAEITRVLGRAPRHPDTFAGPELRAAAVATWGAPALRLLFALLWLWTAFVSWFVWPHEESYAWLAACGVPAEWLHATLLGASVLDAAIGVALLLCRRQWIWPLQLAVVGGYTIALSIFLPQFWLDPFGVLSKNLPLLLLMFVLWRLEARRT